MTDLKVTQRKGAYVIQDYANGRKQVRDKDNKKLTFGNKRKALAYAKELSGAVERKEFKLIDRHKFMDKFKEHADFRIEMANQPGARDSVGGVSGYLSYYKKYLVPHFPDIHLDQVDGPILAEFILTLKTAGVPHKTNKNIIQHIHTFLRWCLYKSYHHEFSSALQWKIGKHGSSYLLPDNDDELYEKETEVLTNEEANKVLAYVEKHKDRSHKDALAYTIFTILALFGLRPSEIQGLKKSNFNFVDRYVWIKGAYLGREGGYRNRTKNEFSYRALDFTVNQSKHLQWIMDYMNKYKQYNPYILPASRIGRDGNHNPIAQFEMRKIIYATYEAVGLAKLNWFTKSNTKQYEIIECRFKNGPAKCWRHYNATMLIDNMYTLGLTPNYIKSRLGHSRWQTTQDRYGNHNMIGTDEMRLERADKVEKALGFDK